MNILFVCEIDYGKKVVFDVHLLPETMSLLGHRIYVLDYEGMWQRDDNKRSKETVVSRAFANSEVHLIRPPLLKVAGLSRVSAFVSHYLEIKRIIKEKKIDAIVLYSVPTNGLQAVHCAKKLGIPIVFRSIDVLNQLVPYPILRSITRYMEKKVYSSVDRILTITPKLSEYVVGLGASPEKASVLPMPVDITLFHPSSSTNGMRRRWGLDNDDKVILFMGTLFKFSGLDRFIFHLPQIVKQFRFVKLLIVGDGEQRQYLERIVGMLKLQENVIITGFQPYRDMPKYINLADVCINTFVDNAVTRDIFPGKTVQFLACGKPLVMRPLNGVKAVIAGEEQGVVYADNDNWMVSEIVSLLNSAERRERIGQNGLRYVRQFHSYEQVAKQLECELIGLVKESHV